MKEALDSYFRQRTTIQGLAGLVVIVVLFKMHIISGDAASAFALGALTLIGIPEAPVTVRQSEPVKLEQPIVAATVPLPQSAAADTAPAALRIPVSTIGETK